MESSSEDIIPKYGYYKIQIKTVKGGKEIYPNFKEIVSSLNKVQEYFSEDYRNIITQILEETDLVSHRIAISHEPLEIISIHSNSPVISIIVGFLGAIITSIIAEATIIGIKGLRKKVVKSYQKKKFLKKKKEVFTLPSADNREVDISIEPLEEEEREITLPDGWNKNKNSYIIIGKENMDFFPNPYDDFKIFIRKGKASKEITTRVLSYNRIGKGIKELQKYFPELKSYEKLTIHKHDYNNYEIIL